MGLCLFLCWLSALASYKAKTAVLNDAFTRLLACIAVALFVAATVCWPEALWWENLIRTLAVFIGLLLFLPFMAHFYTKAIMSFTVCLAIFSVVIEVWV